MGMGKGRGERRGGGRLLELVVTEMKFPESELALRQVALMS